MRASAQRTVAPDLFGLVAETAGSNVEMAAKVIARMAAPYTAARRSTVPKSSVCTAEHGIRNSTVLYCAHTPAM